MTLHDRVVKEECRSVALLGLAKNAGKTVALNSLAAETRAAGESLVLASIGRDGEAFDAVTRKPKPPVPVFRGDRVVTTDRLMEASQMEAERELDLEIPTPLGRAYLYRILSDRGTLVLAGVNHVSGMMKVREAALARADRFYIDGAINRRSSGVPELAEGIIVSAGAVLGTSCEEVVRRTAEAVHILSLPALEVSYGLEKLPPWSDTGAFRAHPEWISLREGRPAPLKELKGLGAVPDVLYRPGALTEAGVQELLTALPAVPEGIILAAADPTKIFLSPRTMKLLAHRGIVLRVVRSLKVLGVTVNPHNPTGPDLPPHRLLEEATRVFAPLRVFDVAGLDYPYSSSPGVRAMAADRPER